MITRLGRFASTRSWSILANAAASFLPKSRARSVAATPAIVTALREKGKLGSVPIILDSRYRMLQYSGITATTPNEPEVEEALGVRIGQDWNKVIAAGEQVMERMKLQSLVITRGRDGMVAFDVKHKPVDVPIFGSDQVTDVTGAGDTVIAAFTAALMCWNWASRSGWLSPSRVLRLPCRL